MISAILAPTDFTSGSDCSVRYAAELAAQFGARLHLLHVGTGDFEAPRSQVSRAAAEIYYLAKHEQSEHRRTTMEQLAAELEALHPGIDVEITTDVGAPDEVILDKARALGADLIVMGTAGHSGVSHFLLGSTTERVVRMSPIPVLTVRDPA